MQILRLKNNFFFIKFNIVLLKFNSIAKYCPNSEAERAGRDQNAQRSLNNLVEQLALENRNPGIKTENVFKDVYELRGKNRARVCYREVDGKIEILGKSV